MSCFGESLVNYPLRQDDTTQESTVIHAEATQVAKTSDIRKEIDAAVSRLQKALKAQDARKICEASRELKDMVDSVYEEPEVWDSELTQTVETLLKQAAQATANTPSAANTAGRAAAFRHRLTNLRAARRLLDRARGVPPTR